MIPRKIATQLHAMLDWFPVVSLVGPRQSGKSTLLRNELPDYAYANLEDPAQRAHAAEDPISFLDQFTDRVVIDEAQHAPDLFSVVQLRADSSGRNGQVVLSSSQNFLLRKSISQSLAGRVGYLTLLPFEYDELTGIGVDDFAFQGGYPRVHVEKTTPIDLIFDNYLSTYIERDVSDYLGVRSLSGFKTFLTLCAHSAGELLNLSHLARETGVAYNTAKAWLSILESSYVIFLLPSVSTSDRAALVKAPKLFFHDTGLLNYLLGIHSQTELATSQHFGHVFENLIVSERVKQYRNVNVAANLSYYRDKNKVEVDLVDRTTDQAELFEVKSGLTPRTAFFGALGTAGTRLGVDTDHRTVVYRGGQEFSTRSGRFMSAKSFLTPAFTRESLRPSR